MAPSSPWGCTIITPGDRARRAREPGVGGTSKPAPGGRHKRSLVEALSSWKSSFPLVVAPSGRGFWGESPPRVASRSALPHPGLFLCGAPRRKNRPDKYQQVLNESSQKPKQCQCNFTEVQLSEGFFCKTPPLNRTGLCLNN